MENITENRHQSCIHDLVAGGANARGAQGHAFLRIYFLLADIWAILEGTKPILEG